MTAMTVRVVPLHWPLQVALAESLTTDEPAPTLTAPAALGINGGCQVWTAESIAR
jgi:hypothetical protein